MSFRKLLPLFFLILLFSCSQWPIQESKLNGFEDGQMRMKYQTSIYSDHLESGDKGFRLETHINYSAGASNRRESVKTTWVGEDFQLVQSTAKRTNNNQVSETSVRRAGNKIVVVRKVPGQDETEEMVPVMEPVYDLHPMLYSRDLTKPGEEKKYAVLNEAKLAVVEITVRFVGPAKIVEGGKRWDCRHYQIESMGRPGEFDSYFLDAKESSIVKIDMTPMVFLPEG